MATVQKTTVRRYNGVDWDSIYFAAAADVTVLGTSSKVVEDSVGFAFDDILEFNDTVAELLIKVINRLTTLDVNHIQKLEAGEGIAELDVSKLVGIIDRSNLPKDVGGKVVEPADENAKDALTADDVNVGDIVKVQGGKTYIVADTQPDGSVVYTDLVDNASTVAWDRITGTPTSAEGYGITDMNVDQINFTGTLPLKIVPKAAISEMITVDSYDDIANLTSDDVQLGDTIKVKDTLNDDGSIKVAGKMYYVVDDTKFGTADWEKGMTQYTAGMASAVYWSGVLDTPTTLAGYGITDAVNVSQVVEDGIFNADTNPTVAGKIVKIAADNKLHADIAGSADKFGGQLPSYYAKDADLQNLIKQILGDPSGETETPPSADPASPVYTGDIETAAEGDAVTWAEKNWVLVSKTDTAAVLALSSLAAVCDSTGVAGAQAAFDAGLSAEAKALVGTGSFAPTQAQLAGYTALTDKTVEHEGADTGWYLADGYVDVTGAVQTDDTGDATSTKGYRPFVTVDLTHSDVGAPKKTLIERVEDIEATLGDPDTEGTVLGDIAKLQTEIDWATIINTPTTLAGYGITDAINVDILIEDGIVSDTNTLDKVTGKVVKIAADGKLHADIAGDAASLEGHKAEYFATKAEHDKLALSVPVLIDSVDDFVNPQVGQMVMIPLAPPVEIGPDGNPIETPATSTNTVVTDTLLGQDFSVIQNISVSADGLTVTGTSNYVTGFTEFSSDPAEQEGNFIALKIEPNPADAVVKVKSKGGDASGYKTLDADHILIWRLTAGKNIEILVNNTPYTIDVSGVTMEPNNP